MCLFFGLVEGLAESHRGRLSEASDVYKGQGFAVSTLAQLGNLHCHVYQASLRADGSKAYKEPKRGLFAYVTCANYACEIYQWVGFNVATQSACGWFFVLCGGFQMFDWANAKHARLRKLFPGFKRQWKLLPPFY